ncbi:MAG: hypothetical protein OXN44_12700 [Acidimicrobiaceae bacterium]|nr:hypothetical protein [Acidimicrobiaceae bacterium]
MSINERHVVFNNFESAIDLIEMPDRGRSLYLSKFLAAVGAGLFDAALNYLWDETVAELRRRIASYDLAYFFDVAVTSPERRKNLRTEEDLSRVEDQELIRASREMELVSDVGYQQLDLIRYMRNHASAAHPNQNDVMALQLLGYLQTCIREVITLPESNDVAETKRLLQNVRSGKVDATTAKATAEFFQGLNQVQADNIAAGLFGIYVEPTSAEPARDSVRMLLPKLWPLVGENQKQHFGMRYGRFVANGDHDQANLARQLLNVVSASAYLPTAVRVAELGTAIDDLLLAHRSFNNFHTEPGPARRLDSLAGEKVPKASRAPYVAALVEVFLTNGNGIAWNADPYYRNMVSRFSPKEAELAMRELFNETVQSKLRWDIPKTKYTELLEILDPKITRPVARDLMDAICSFGGTPNALAKDTELRRLLRKAFSTN